MAEVIDADFIDFGCSDGGSIQFAMKRFGVSKGVGVDIDPKKVAATREKGYEAIVSDASQLDLPPKSVSFAIMSHFLEHLPGHKIAQKCIASACRVSRDFVYIRHPWFDSDYPLFLAGYKFYWSDWHGHTAHIGAQQLDSMFRRISLAKEWTLYGRGPVTDWSDTCIVPLTAPFNSGPDHGNTRSGPLGFTAYREVCAVVRVGSVEAYDAAKAKLVVDHKPLS